MLKSFALPALAALILFNSATALADGNTHQYNIPAQSLNNALMQFAADSNLKLLLTADTVRGMSAKGLNGSMTPPQALTQLLQGSGMTYRFVDGGTVTIEPPSNFKKTAVVNEKPQSNNETGSDTTLPKVTVEADSAYDPEYYADPYNKDYVIPNATAGTKTNTPVMETPLNVQVISKQVLKDQQVINLGQALKNVSGVTVSNGASVGGAGGGLDQSFFLRGFESQTFFRNGFRLQQGAASKGMANVESVEVLKGSAAGLYGLVDPGGMVNVITKQPLATPYYGFSQQFGSYDLYRTTIDATGPITKNKDLLYRMNMSYQNSGSFREFVGKEDVFLAPVLKWVISPKTQATFELEYNHQHLGLDNTFVPLANGNGTRLNTPRSRNYGEYSPGTVETIFGGFNWSHQFNDDWSIKHSFSVNQRNDIRSHFVLPTEADNVNVSRFQFSGQAQNNTYSTNLDLIGHFDTAGLHHTLLLGGDYYRLDRSTDFRYGLTNLGTFDFSTINIQNPRHPGTPFTFPLQPVQQLANQTDQYGLYIQDQIKLPYNIQVMGGIRYQYLHLSNREKIDQTSDGRSDDAVTPRVGFLWQPKSWISLYANYVESFGPNEPDTILLGNTLPPPTSAEQYEGGIKTEFFDGRLRATLTYYDLTKTNIATPHPDPKLASDGISVVTGAVRSRGPELDIIGEILPGWNVIATYTNIDARVTKTNNTDFQPIGSRFWNVPRNNGSLWSTYEAQDGDFRGFKFGGGVTLRDGQTVCCDIPAFKIPGYATVDLLAAYSLDIGKTKVTAQLNINNLLDKHYITAGKTDIGRNQLYVDFGQPRTFMGSINIQY
ncbi:MAG: TonB-dependent receptor [Methyloglobulus sp.]|nr:TonB-dependent receptor [Methyloglobulus sp.]